MDYEKLGLKAGLEIHQQLVGNRLFCCDSHSELNDSEPDFVAKRRLYAVAGELGEVDPAAMQAQMRGVSYVYEYHDNVNCLVAIDEEPPVYSNKEAINTAIQVALMLNSNVIDELHLMRKTVVDGSNPSGFQRTMLVAVGGKLKHEKSEIGIPTICVEEDAARKTGTKGKEIFYNLDRLGIPLLEITTEPTIKTPEDVKSVARDIGDIIRATGTAKRGIGTIRQDLNISIKDGARIEIKGVQELNLLSKNVENEVQRQLKLLELRNELKKSGVKEVETKPIDATDIFKNTNSGILKKCIESKEKVCVLKLEKFAGFLKKELLPDRRFGTELAEYAKAYGANRIMHSDELPAYGITQEEVKDVESKLDVKANDAFILITHSGNYNSTMEKIIERINYALVGVPEETRNALPDGTSSYMRPLPGKARMYPETDLYPLVVTNEKLSKLKKSLPKMPWEQVKDLCKKYNLAEQVARELYRSEYFEMFEKLSKSTKTEPKIIAATLIDTLRSIETGDIELSYAHFRDLFTGLDKGSYSKEALPNILESWFKNPDKKLDALAKELNLGGLSDKGLEHVISKIVKDNKKIVEEKGERALQPLMGMVMKEVRGKADGKLVMDILRKKVNEL